MDGICPARPVVERAAEPGPTRRNWCSTIRLHLAIPQVYLRMDGIYDNDRTHWTFHFVSEEAVLPSVLRLPYTARPSHHNHGRSTSPSCLVVVLGCFESLGRGAYMESNLVALQQRFSGVIIRPHFQSHETRRLLSRSAIRRGQAPHLPSVTVVVWNGCHRGFAVPQLRRRALIHTSTRLFLC